MLTQPLSYTGETDPGSRQPSGSFRAAFCALARRTTDVVTLVDEKGVVQLIAGPVKRTFGTPKGAVVGTSLFSYVRPCDMERVRTALGRCIRQPKKAQAIEFRLRASDTNWYQVEPFGTLRHDDPPCGRVLRIRDITARRSLEEVLRQQSDMLEALSEASPVAIVVEDVSGNVRIWSAAAERLFGWRAGEVVGRPSPLNLPSEIDAHRSLRDRVLTGTTFTALETRRQTKDGTLLEVSMSTAALRDHAGVVRGVLEVMLDVTERSQLEAQLRQAQKMEAVGRLAGGIAHDFNNVLTAITGYTRLVKSQIDADSSMTARSEGAGIGVHEALDEIDKAATRAAALTRSLLAFSRSQVMQPTVLDLNSVVTGLQRMLQRLLGEHIELTTVPARDLGRVRADRSQLEQVIMNLVVNANDAMPNGGKLLIETDNVELDDDYARRRMPVSPGEYVMLAVSDNGCGMDGKTRARAFEPFFTTKEVGKGTGLGLSTVYGIVRQSGGHVWVYSEVGRGTTVRVYLPRAYPDARTSTCRLSVSTAASRGTETVLVVEDERVVRTLVRHVLALYGYAVIEAENGQEALARAAEFQGRIDLMVTDLVMPGMSAADLIERLQASRPEMKVLCMSGYTHRAATDWGVLTSQFPFVSKPFAPDRFASIVRSVLDGIDPRHPEATDKERHVP